MHEGEQVNVRFDKIRGKWYYINIALVDPKVIFKLRRSQLPPSFYDPYSWLSQGEWTSL